LDSRLRTPTETQKGPRASDPSDFQYDLVTEAMYRRFLPTRPANSWRVREITVSFSLVNLSSSSEAILTLANDARQGI
jgi:hypothetical protein